MTAQRPDFKLSTYLGFLVIYPTSKAAWAVVDSMDLPLDIVKTGSSVTFSILTGTEERCQRNFDLFNQTLQSFLDSGLVVA